MVGLADLSCLTFSPSSDCEENVREDCVVLFQWQRKDGINQMASGSGRSACMLLSLTHLKAFFFHSE